LLAELLEVTLKLGFITMYSFANLRPGEIENHHIKHSPIEATLIIALLGVPLPKCIVLGENIKCRLKCRFKVINLCLNLVLLVFPFLIQHLAGCVEKGLQVPLVIRQKIRKGVIANHEFRISHPKIGASESKNCFKT